MLCSLMILVLITRLNVLKVNDHVLTLYLATSIKKVDREWLYPRSKYSTEEAIGIFFNHKMHLDCSFYEHIDIENYTE